MSYDRQEALILLLLFMTLFFGALALMGYIAERVAKKKREESVSTIQCGLHHYHSGDILKLTGAGGATRVVIVMVTRMTSIEVRDIALWETLLIWFERLVRDAWFAARARLLKTFRKENANDAN